jgi:hypothetical protein
MLIALLLALGTADALIYSGNPDWSFYVDNTGGTLTGGEVWLNKVRIHRCDGGYTEYAVQQSVDPVVGHTVVDITGGDLCAATMYWGSDMELSGSGFTLRYAENTTTVSLDPLSAAWLTPYDVTSGTLSGGAPKLFVTLQ